MSWPKFQDGETPFDLSGLKDRTITTRTELNEAEARNMARAITKYLSSPPSKKLAPFSFSWMLKLHKEMFGNVWDWAGQARKVNLNLGMDFAQVEVQVLELERDLEFRKKQGQMSLLEQATRLHHRAVVIHPFVNGNGRWARLLTNIFLLQNGMDYVLWPEGPILSGESSIRKEYLAALRDADNGKIDSLQRLHEEYLG
jgi:Fic-DOC domain mobile mystery protein B